MSHNYRYFAAAMLVGALLFGACSKDEPKDNGKTDIEKLRFSTRTDDGNPLSGETVGLFMVERNDWGGQQELAWENALVRNMRLTEQNGTWTPANPIYWGDRSADFHAYWPYDSSLSVSNFGNVVFNTYADQENESAYKRSDFLFGSSLNLAKGTAEVDITLHHLVSMLEITIEAGEGVDAAELGGSDLKVNIGGVCISGKIDFSKGKITASGSKSTVKALRTDALSYRALLIPQTVSSYDDFITVSWGEKRYTLRRDVTLEANKKHHATVTIKRSSSGISIGIGAWEESDEDFGGTVS